jgi:hypothetical protein
MLMLALTAATKSIELLRAMKDLDKQYSQAELKAKAAELLSNLADVKVALVDAPDQIAEKEREIVKLRSAFQLRQETDNFSFDKDEQGRPIGWPYCYRCEQIDGVMIKVHQGGGRDMVCPQCKRTYGSMEYRPY